MLLTADAIVTGRDVLRPGWIEVSDEVVIAVGTGRPPDVADAALGAATVVPGFVDTHVHGGAGFDFSTADTEGVTAAVDFHRRNGTTTLVASLVSLGPAELIRRVEVLSALVRDGLIAGIHLEGPWLSIQRCGAHDPALLRDPEPAEIDHILRLGESTIRMVTVAPERPGAMHAIARIAASGAVAAIGHTEATYEQTCAAIDAGASVATHLFNAMRPIHHREPGPIVALLDEPRVTLELICDGVHLDAALYRHVLRCAGEDRISLITDAMAATGMPDGCYHIGDLSVDVVDQVARVSGTPTIAGSTATMDRVFRNSVAQSGISGDGALLLAVQQTSINPARALRLPAPELRVGGPANLVVLNAQLTVEGVLHNGSWVHGAHPDQTVTSNICHPTIGSTAIPETSTASKALMGTPSSSPRVVM